MSTRTPRHRGELTPAQRKNEREVVSALVFLLGAGVYLVLLATVWDRGATLKALDLPLKVSALSDTAPPHSRARARMLATGARPDARSQGTTTR